MQTNVTAKMGGPDGSAPDTSAPTRTETPAENPPGDNQADGEQPVAQEDQATYDKVMTAAMAQLYGDDATHNAIVKKLRDEAGNLVHGVGHTAAMMLKSIIGNAEQAGADIPPDVIVHAGAEIVAELCDIAAAAGLVKEGPDSDKLFHDASLQATQIYGQTLEGEGKITPDMMSGAQATMRDQMAQEQGSAPKKGIINRAVQPQPQPQPQGAAP